MFDNIYFIIKRPIGHVTHVRNQFKLMNTFEQMYDYMYTYHKNGPVVLKEKIS